MITALNGYLLFSGPSLTTFNADDVLNNPANGAGQVDVLVRHNTFENVCISLVGIFPPNSNFTFFSNKMTHSLGWSSYSNNQFYHLNTGSSRGGASFWDIFFARFLNNSQVYILDNHCTQTRFSPSPDERDNGHQSLVEWISAEFYTGTSQLIARNTWVTRVLQNTIVDCNHYMFLSLVGGMKLLPCSSLLIEDNSVDVFNNQSATFAGPSTILRCDNCVVQNSIFAIRRLNVIDFTNYGKTFASLITFMGGLSVLDHGIFELSGTKNGRVLGSQYAGIVYPQPNTTHRVTIGRNSSIIIANNFVDSATVSPNLKTTINGTYVIQLNMAITGSGARIRIEGNTFRLAKTSQNDMKGISITVAVMTPNTATYDFGVSMMQNNISFFPLLAVGPAPPLLTYTVTPSVKLQSRLSLDRTTFYDQDISASKSPMLVVPNQGSPRVVFASLCDSLYYDTVKQTSIDHYASNPASTTFVLLNYCSDVANLGTPRYPACVITPTMSESIHRTSTPSLYFKTHSPEVSATWTRSINSTVSETLLETHSDSLATSVSVSVALTPSSSDVASETPRIPLTPSHSVIQTGSVSRGPTQSLNATFSFTIAQSVSDAKLRTATTAPPPSISASSVETNSRSLFSSQTGTRPDSATMSSSGTIFRPRSRTNVITTTAEHENSLSVNSVSFNLFTKSSTINWRNESNERENPQPHNAAEEDPIGILEPLLRAAALEVRVSRNLFNQQLSCTSRFEYLFSRRFAIATPIPHLNKWATFSGAFAVNTGIWGVSIVLGLLTLVALNLVGYNGRHNAVAVNDDDDFSLHGKKNEVSSAMLINVCSRARFPASAISCLLLLLAPSAVGAGLGLGSLTGGVVGDDKRTSPQFLGGTISISVIAIIITPALAPVLANRFCPGRYVAIAKPTTHNPRERSNSNENTSRFVFLCGAVRPNPPLVTAMGPIVADVASNHYWAPSITTSLLAVLLWAGGFVGGSITANSKPFASNIADFPSNCAPIPFSLGAAALLYAIVIAVWRPFLGIFHNLGEVALSLILASTLLAWGIYLSLKSEESELLGADVDSLSDSSLAIITSAVCALRYPFIVARVLGVRLPFVLNISPVAPATRNANSEADLDDLSTPQNIFLPEIGEEPLDNPTGAIVGELSSGGEDTTTPKTTEIDMPAPSASIPAPTEQSSSEDGTSDVDAEMDDILRGPAYAINKEHSFRRAAGSAASSSTISSGDDDTEPSTETDSSSSSSTSPPQTKHRS